MISLTLFSTLMSERRASRGRRASRDLLQPTPSNRKRLLLSRLLSKRGIRGPDKAAKGHLSLCPLRAAKAKAVDKPILAS